MLKHTQSYNNPRMHVINIKFNDIQRPMLSSMLGYNPTLYPTMVTINPMLTATLGCVLLEQPSKLPLKTTQCCFATLGVLVCCEEAVLSCFA